jgi:cytochrome c oxidase subunit II
MPQSVLDAAGIQAERIEQLWWVMFWTTSVVTVIVLAVLAGAVMRARRQDPQTRAGDPRLHRYIAAGTIATVVILFGLLVATIITSRAVASQYDDQALQIEVVANQWWWSVEYQHPEPEQRVRTANELHIPVGRTVGIKLLANDVIHSFWVPALHGKMDAIPGHEGTLWLRADRAGIYRGQCAEYCGAQHAHMAFVVIAEPSEVFERWIQAQRTTAAQPQTAQEQRGLYLVQRSACVMCHTIRGTAAGGRMGPDLTHLASRGTILAATAPRTPENLHRLIRDPQQFKPGTRMPPLNFSDDDRAAIVAYLERLR